MDSSNQGKAIQPGWHQLQPINLSSGEEHYSQSEIHPAHESAATYAYGRPSEWISKWLQLPVILAAAVTTVVLMVTIIALAEVNRRHNGIASVDLQSQSLAVILGVFDVGIGLLWTSLPALILTIYNLVITAIFRQAAARQPYVELRGFKDPNWGSAAETSIFLDYASHWEIFAPWKAFRNRHYLLMCSFSVGLVMHLLLTPLSAYILRATIVPFDRPVGIQRTSEVNERGLGARDTLVPTMNIAASTQIYGGQNIPWTTDNASIVPFSLPQAVRTIAAWNLTTTAIANAAQMDCRLLGSSDFELLQADDGHWYFSMRDRGCSMTDKLFVSQIGEVYVHFIWTYWTECSLDAYYGRVVVVAAENSNSTLTNKIGISCIPSYHRVTGILDLAAESSSREGFSIRSFKPIKSEQVDPYPEYGSNFARQLEQASFNDPTAKLYSNTFGSLIFDAAKHISQSTSLSGKLLLNVTASMYISTFAIMSREFLMTTSSSSTSVSGTISTTEVRVIVVPAVAYTVVGILAATLATLGCIYWYTKSHDSILYEEPVALVGAATILRNSGLMSWIQSINADDCEGKVAQRFEFELGDAEPVQGWRVDQWESPSQMAIVPTARARSDLKR